MLGTVLEDTVNVVREITYEDVRHAFIVQAAGRVRNPLVSETPLALDESISSVDAWRAILLHVDDLDLALRMADVADDITQTAFAAKTFTTHVKDDGTPVTDADVAVEEALVRLLDHHRADDAVLSEELGARGRSRRTWIIDGIDGTATFARGGSGWGTLIALQVEDEVTVGVATSPALGRRWWAARGREHGQHGFLGPPPRRSLIRSPCPALTPSDRGGLSTRPPRGSTDGVDGCHR